MVGWFLALVLDLHFMVVIGRSIKLSIERELAIYVLLVAVL